MQCFHNSESVAHITEKVRPPRDEILSSPLLYVGVPGFAIGTLRLRVSFHLHVPSSQRIRRSQDSMQPICVADIQKRGECSINSSRCRPVDWLKVNISLLPRTISEYDLGL
jgi:hypothetical protein